MINTFKEPCGNPKYWLFCVILTWQNKLRKGSLERGIESFSLIWLIPIPQENVVLFTRNVFCVVLGIEHSASCVPDSALILAYFYGIPWVSDSSCFRYVWENDHPFIPSLRSVPKGHWWQCEKMVSTQFSNSPLCSWFVMQSNPFSFHFVITGLENFLFLPLSLSRKLRLKNILWINKWGENTNQYIDGKSSCIGMKSPPPRQPLKDAKLILFWPIINQIWDLGIGFHGRNCVEYTWALGSSSNTKNNENRRKWSA